MNKITVGSICSGIEAASVALKNLNYNIKWFSEISEFPSKVLTKKYPNTPNLGDMCNLPDLIQSKEIFAPDIICGGTPCQAFSLAGWKKGLDDDRGNLTLKFVDIIEKNDAVRLTQGKSPTLALWENVEGVLRDKTNAFGCLLSSLLGTNDELKMSKWPKAGIIHGPKRNIAWRVLDAKYFGLPHQRKRLYVLSSGKDLFPENILFDNFPEAFDDYNQQNLIFQKNGHSIEVFRSYTDCLYTAYGTKWNGNAAAYNGSLFVAQNNRLRRLTPLECERLMGFPDDYTHIEKARRTNKYQALGNSWAVPVIQWIASRLENEIRTPVNSSALGLKNVSKKLTGLEEQSQFFEPATAPQNPITETLSDVNLNGSSIPEKPILGDIQNIIDTEPDEKLYLSPVGCKGILRRKEERDLRINPRLEYYLSEISSTMSDGDIENISRRQSRGRGRFSLAKKRFKIIT